MDTECPLDCNLPAGGQVSSIYVFFNCVEFILYFSFYIFSLISIYLIFLFFILSLVEQVDPGVERAGCRGGAASAITSWRLTRRELRSLRRGLRSSRRSLG